MEPRWKQTSDSHWIRDDGAVVKFDAQTKGSTIKPWLPQARGWMAFVPWSNSTFLGYRTGQRLASREPAKWAPRKFKTAAAAMAALDRAHPPGQEMPPLPALLAS